MQKGFSSILLLVLILFLFVAGFFGYSFLIREKNQSVKKPVVVSSPVPVLFNSDNFMAPLNSPFEGSRSASIKPSGKSKLDDYDFSKQQYGALGYTSTVLSFGDKKNQLNIIPKNFAHDYKNYICENQPVIVDKIDLTLQLGDKDKNLLDQVTYNGHILVDALEVNSTFKQMKSIAKSFPIETVAYVIERASCFNSRVALFGFDPKMSKIIQYPFVLKEGKFKNYVYVPKGESTPMQDADGNIVEQWFDDKISKLWKIKYKFNVEKNAFEELSRT